MEQAIIANSSNNAASPSAALPNNANTQTQNQTVPQTPNQNNPNEKVSIYTKVLDIEQFLPQNQQIIKEFLCPLCTGVFYNPVIDQCGHVFCNHCFITYLKHNKPECPTLSVAYKTGDAKLFQQAPAYFTQIIGKQKTHCIKKDCNWINELSKLHDHIRHECVYVIIKCQFKENGCKYSSTRTDIKIHEATCSYRIFECACKDSISFTIARS